MKIVVCLKEVIDTSLNLGYGQVSEALMRKGLAFRLNPNDTQALAEALKLKEKGPNVEITLLSIGPERIESRLKDGLAMGADKAVRIWDDDFTDLSPYQNARLLSRAISLMNVVLVLTGAKSLDNASGLVGPFIAAWLDMPCVCEVVGFQLESNKNAVTVTRNVSKGVQEQVVSTLPAVLAVANSKEKLPYVSLDQILESQEAAITHYSLSDLGISPLDLQKDPTRVTGISFPRPRPKAVPYDSSLPAFYRILALLQGGISKRRGEILKGNTDELVNQLFELLIKEEVIKPAAK